MKLSKNCKYVLELLKSNPPQPNSALYDAFIWTQVIDGRRLDYAAYMGVLETLTANSLIAWADNEHKTFILTDAGKNYKKLTRRERLSVWSNRILGFISGIAASVIVELLVQFIRLKISA